MFTVTRYSYSVSDKAIQAVLNAARKAAARGVRRGLVVFAILGLFSATSFAAGPRGIGGAGDTKGGSAPGGGQGMNMGSGMTVKNQIVASGLNNTRITGMTMTGGKPMGTGMSMGGSNSTGMSNSGIVSGIKAQDLKIKDANKGMNDKVVDPKLLDPKLVDKIKINDAVKINQSNNSTASNSNGGKKVDKVVDLKNLDLKNGGAIKSATINKDLVKKAGQFDTKLLKTDTVAKLQLDKQLKLIDKGGDLALKLDLGKSLQDKGGWQKRLCGPIDPNYTKNCIGFHCCGPSWYPTVCWYPSWCGWVDWCYHYDCGVCYCDPRPIFCRPICYNPCPVWTVWYYPVWQPLPVVACGTYVDVPVAPAAGLDLQLLSVRLVDNGHPEKQLGPRYRVWVRNNSEVAINKPFNVLLMGSNGTQPAADLPQAGVTVPSIEAGKTEAIDIRLPFEINIAGRDAEGHQAPLANLHVLVDSDRAIAETNEANNGTVLARREILPVDPVLLGMDLQSTSGQAVIRLAGEGFGPEAGQVMVIANGQELQAEIMGWYDLGAQVRLPNVNAADVQLILVRGDGAVSNPLPVTLAVAQAAPNALPAATLTR